VSRRGRNAALFAAAAVALTVLGGCGVPVDRGPTALARSAVPFALLAPSKEPTTSTTLVSPVEVPIKIFLVGTSGSLVAVDRAVPAPQESLATVLNALVDGPTQAEAAAGLLSAIPPQTTVLGASITTAGLATVDMGGTFGQLVGQAQIEAVAQVVFTATSLSGVNVTGVAFQLAGQAIEVPVASGAQVPEANQSQFASLAPQP
jgi:hypothetical protein